jgi:hypothetical protein
MASVSLGSTSPRAWTASRRARGARGAAVRGHERFAELDALGHEGLHTLKGPEVMRQGVGI